MSNSGLIGLLLILINFVFSYKGLIDKVFFNRYAFEVDGILMGKEYHRLMTSGFLHVNWVHLIFNMLSLYAFCGTLEYHLGHGYFALLYFASLVSGNLLALYIHRNHGDYTAVGASGAVCGVVFASVALYPGMHIGFFGLPFSMPGWLYGILYVGYSIVGIRSGKDNIGHGAHLGGALIGMIIAILLFPESLRLNYLPILLMTLPTLAFMITIVLKPNILLLNTVFSKKDKNNYDIDHKYNQVKAMKQKDLNKILDKINKNGMESLTKREKLRLKELSD